MSRGWHVRKDNRFYHYQGRTEHDVAYNHGAQGSGSPPPPGGRGRLIVYMIQVTTRILCTVNCSYSTNMYRILSLSYCTVHGLHVSSVLLDIRALRSVPACDLRRVPSAVHGTKGMGACEKRDATRHTAPATDQP